MAFRHGNGRSCIACGNRGDDAKVIVEGVGQRLRRRGGAIQPDGTEGMSVNQQVVPRRRDRQVMKSVIDALRLRQIDMRGDCGQLRQSLLMRFFVGREPGEGRLLPR